MNDIHKATEQGNLDRVKEILDSDPAQVHARASGREPGDQPLHLAAWQGRKKIAEYLLDAGADINSAGDGGRTPLYYAVEKIHPAITKMLIKRGANVNVKNEAGCTPLYLAACVGDHKTIGLFQKAGAEQNLNSSIYIDGADQVLKQLNANPHLLDEVMQPGTLLTDAIRVESPKLVEFLLAHGVSPNAAGWMNSNPLLDAIGTGNADIVTALLKHGADTTVKDHIGQGVLAFAEEYRAGNEIINTLKEHDSTL